MDNCIGWQYALHCKCNGCQPPDGWMERHIKQQPCITVHTNICTASIKHIHVITLWIVFSTEYNMTYLMQEETGRHVFRADQHSAGNCDWQDYQQDMRIPSAIPPHNGNQLTTAALALDPTMTQTSGRSKLVEAASNPWGKFRPLQVGPWSVQLYLQSKTTRSSMTDRQTEVHTTCSMITIVRVSHICEKKFQMYPWNTKC